MQEEFDYIVVGGGSGGCVVAARLTEQPGVKVCLLEAGGDGSNPLINTPIGGAAMLPTRVCNWALETVPQPGLDGRRGYQPRGKALGGSSAINAMVYVRGHRWDYDHWAALGNPGWSYEEVLPYFIRSEGNETLHDEYHGSAGPLSVSDSRTHNPLHAHFLEAARQVGLPITRDFNGASQEGLGIYQVTQRNGRRCSAARAYLFPHMGQRNGLSVRTRAQVRRIIFDERRAVGVEFMRDGHVHFIRAQKEVVLAAGAFQTPQLLMLSGIGDGADLVSFGIPVVKHLPGVGKNLQDHPDFVFAFRSHSRDSFGVSLAGATRMLSQGWRYLREGRGALTSNFAEAGGFLKSSADQAIPDLQLHFVVALVEDHARQLRLGHGLSCHVCLLRPRSRGQVSLASADVRVAPMIDPAFLADPRDVDDLIAGFKLTRRLLRAPALAAHINEDLRTNNIETDDEIRGVLRRYVDTVYHPVGTCRMGNDDAAVVDASLLVRGVEGLRIVDASVMPTLIGGNTNAPTIMIAEKAADMMLNRTAPRRANRDDFALA